MRSSQSRKLEVTLMQKLSGLVQDLQAKARLFSELNAHVAA